VIALAENDDSHRILEFARHACNKENVASDNASLNKHAEILATKLGMVDGEVRVVNPDGSARMVDPIDGSGVPMFFPVSRLINEELCRDVPEFRWKPYP
jgi:hypothetical protein